MRIPTISGRGNGINRRSAYLLMYIEIKLIQRNTLIRINGLIKKIMYTNHNCDNSYQNTLINVLN